MAKRSRNQARQRRHNRVRKTVYGTPERPRLNVFRSITDIYAQIIDDEKGITLCSASSIDGGLRDGVSKKNKLDQAAMVGEELAKRALAKDIKSVVMDRGGYFYTGRVKALAEGARKGGLDF
ncbi:MAG: 50S ribosomal protein L18 [Anaerolineaceae bacterium]|nr:50S ribosomal protein L18 [Anaerolineaceae bacterium]